MPDSWWERMSTIQNYDSDASAMGRINAWVLAWNVAKAHFFGGGYFMYTQEIFGRFAPNPLDVHVAHSIYFSVMAEHGFVGLGLFLLLWAATWRAAGWAARDPRVRHNHEFAWARMLSSMIKVSMVGYLVGGAFLSLAYFDLPYYLLAIVAVTRAAVEHELSTSPEARQDPTRTTNTLPEPIAS
jgi:probable O-glycosylation ligase (exosortase A-associated)